VNGVSTRSAGASAGEATNALILTFLEEREEAFEPEDAGILFLNPVAANHAAAAADAAETMPDA
jgi:hypothetical protein